MQYKKATKLFAKFGFIDWFDMVIRNSIVHILNVSHSLEQISYFKNAQTSGLTFRSGG